MVSYVFRYNRLLLLLNSCLVVWNIIIDGFNCDLPPNCLHGDVIGTWRIYVGKYKPCSENSDFEDPTCGFPSPDREDAHEHLTPGEDGLKNKNFELSFIFEVKFTNNELKVISVDKLSDNNTQKDSEFETINTIGNWTVILDQGFTFWTKNYRYIAFFKYKNEEEDINTSYSYCHTTLLGWWDSYPQYLKNEDHLDKNEILTLKERKELGYTPWLLMRDDMKIKRGCWYGMRIYDGNGKKTNRSEWTLKLPRWRISPLGLPPDHPINAQNPTVAEYLSELSQSYSNIKEGDNLWNRTDRFDIKGNEELNDLNKIRKILKISPHYLPRKKSESEYVNEIAKVKKNLDLNEELKKEPIWMRIKSFDWSNPIHVYGRIGKKVTLIPEAKYQGDCGNCFAMTAATILTTRLWIKYFGVPEIFKKIHASSIQMTECNIYNQGCGGGLITLAFKFAQDIGIRTEECLNDYSRLLGIKQIYPNPVDIPEEIGLADDGHSFLETKNKNVKDRGLNEKRENDVLLEEMEEYLDKNHDYHIFNSFDYNNKDQEIKTSSKSKELKFKLTEQMCWDLGGQLGFANRGCKVDIPITKKIPDSCSKIIKVKEYSYINNVYGKTTVRDIMDSIWNEGPVAVSLEPTLEFSLYKSGIFKGFYDPITRKYPWSDIQWYKVDHAMVITGWGWEIVGNERIPYWIVQNSWGNNWGEQGYCRIIRGVNELSIEHAAVRASVVIYDLNKKYKPTNKEELFDKSVFQYI